MADENQRINPKNSNLDIREYPSFWQRKKKTIIALLVIGVVLIGVAVLIGYLGAYYRTQAYKTILADNLNVQNVIVHLKTFESIANSSSGTRAVGTVGYNASGEYVLQQLRQVGYTPTVQYFPITTWTPVGTPTLEQISPVSVSYLYNVDFGLFINSIGASNLVAPVSPILNYGCQASDYSNFRAGYIALIQRGNCTFLEKIANGFSANASAVIIFNNAENGGVLYRARTNSSFPIPALTATLSFGTFLSQLLQLNQSVVLRMNFAVSFTNVVTYNILAETSSGRPNRVIVSGSHLDSVPAGPGINDNGSGAAANLEIALLVATLKLEPVNKIRFAWWGAEELGLLGSQYYVTNLQKTNVTELRNIALNLNFDMIGSPNFMRGIYNGSTAPNEVKNGATIIQQLYEKYFSSHQLPYSLVPFDGRSDYGPFIDVGIPAGGLFTGAEKIKNATERAIYGGLAGASYDPCYHQPCDTVANINVQVLDDMSHAMAQILQDLAYNETLVNQIATNNQL